MMNKNRFVTALAMLLMLALSCSKETALENDAVIRDADGENPASVRPPRPQMTLSAFSQGAEDEAAPAEGEGSGEDTKLSFIDNSASTGKFAVKWNTTISSETIRVLGKDAGGNYVDDDNIVFTGSSRLSDHQAVFTGDTPTSASKTFDILYPSDYTSVEDFYTRGFGQKQASSGSTAHLSYNAKYTGLDQCSYVNFSKRYADEQGLDFYCTSCLKLWIQLPDAITSVQELSIISSDAENFYRTNDPSSKTSTLSVSFANGAVDVDTYRTITAYLMLAGFDQTLSASNTYTFKVIDQDGYVWTRSWRPSANTTMTMGNLYTLKIARTGFVKGNRYMDGSGTEADPYVITTPYQLLNVNSLLVTGQKKYFSLAADIDMSGQSWVPLHNAWGNMPIDLEGGNHTVSNIKSNIAGSYNGFFGHLVGTVRNLSIDKIEITYRGGYPSGALAGWIGSNPQTNAYTASVENVHVSNALVSNTMSSAVGTGGFAGRSGNSSFVNCSFSGEVKNHSTLAGSMDETSSPTGGIIAYDYGSNRYENVSFTGSISVANTFNNVGGIIGYASSATTLSGCEAAFTSLSLDNSSNIGGLVGYSDGELEIVGDATDKTHVRFPAFTALSFIGGIVGRTTAAPAISDYEIVMSATASSEPSRVAGVLGYSSAGSTISGCMADVTLLGASSLAGIVAYGTGTTTVSDCRVSGSITADNTYEYPCIAGIIGGSTGTTTISNCHCDAAFSSGGTSTGGIYGQSGDNAVITIEDCSFEGSISSSGTYVSGIMAYGRNCGNVTISRCFSSGDVITGKASNYGAGILALAYMSSSDYGVSISDCWVSGTVQCNGYGGGIVGDLPANSSVTNCFFNGTLKGSWSSGGIVGRACNRSNTVANATLSTGFGNTISGCVCWADLITCTDNYKRSTTNGYSDGAIVGFTNAYNTLSNCWRKAGLNFLWYSTTHGGAEWDPTANALKDQADANSSVALTNFPQGQTTPNQSPYQYDYPYNGKAASAEETLSAVAQRIGWSISVWDFSDDIPVLK